MSTTLDDEWESMTVQGRRSTRSEMGGGSRERLGGEDEEKEGLPEKDAHDRISEEGSSNPEAARNF